MKFVDEATIKVQAGNGGRGMVSFRREKFIPFGGPDGGDGGTGGSVYLVARQGLNTLADFRYQRTFKGDNGQPGGSADCSGRGGEDLEVVVPIGTVVYDTETDETLGDLTHDGERILVAKGGRGGLGNQHFKSSTNRSPRRATTGYPGEKRELRLELKLIADVGLLGLPNAGKSTLISAIRFLKHLQRTRVLLHLVDIAPPDPDADPVKDARAIAAELKKFSPELATRERWLVLNKIDLLPPADAEKRCNDIVRRLRWKGPVFRISGATRAGTKELCQAIMRRLDELAATSPRSEVEEG